MNLPKHLMVSCEGDLYDTRDHRWWERQPIRVNYTKHHRHIESVADLKATLRAGDVAWPGCYPLFFICADGHTISFDGVREDLRREFQSIKDGDSDRVEYCVVNWEDTELECAVTGKPIESAYGEPD